MPSLFTKTSFLIVCYFFCSLTSYASLNSLQYDGTLNPLQTKPRSQQCVLIERTPPSYNTNHPHVPYRTFRLTSAKPANTRSSDHEAQTPQKLQRWTGHTGHKRPSPTTESTENNDLFSAAFQDRKLPPLPPLPPYPEQHFLSPDDRVSPYDCVPVQGENLPSFQEFVSVLHREDTNPVTLYSPQSPQGKMQQTPQQHDPD